MEFRVLGALEVRDEQGRPLVLHGRQQPVLLAMLLLNANRPVPIDLLIDVLWQGRPPSSARHGLHLVVHRLRQTLADHGASARLRTRGGAYSLTVEPGELDSDRFEQHVQRARDAVAAGRLAEAIDDYDTALALWKGPPLADVAAARFAQPVIARLQALHVAALTERAEAALELGRHAELIPALEELVGRYPLQERLHRLLILALYRSGRQAEALTAYQRARAVLVDQFGIEPSAELRQLQHAILTQDPAVSAPLASPPPGPAATDRGPAAADAAEQPAEAEAPGEDTDRVERRSVTILAAQLKTARSAGGDPEALWAQHRRLVQRLRREVRRLGGVVYGDVGETLVAAFGIPRAHPDDPLRAVRTALAVLDELPDHERAAVGVGIDSGEAVVTIPSAPGDPPYVSGEVVYDAVTIARRAPAGEVLVGPGAHELTAQALTYRPVERADSDLTGRAWTVWQTTDADPAAGHATPLVGRDRELVILRELLDRACEDLEPQLVTVIGAPGVGKTRLVAELRRQVLERAEAVTWREGRSPPYGEGVTFWALAEIIKASAGIQPTDSLQDAEQRLERLVGAALRDAPGAARVSGYLRRLVHPERAVDDDAGWRQEAFAAWRAFLEASAGSRPLVLVLEDLHWADDALLDFVEYLAGHAQGVPLLLICLAWPDLLDRRAHWGGGTPNATTISLPALSTTHTQQFLDQLLAQPVGDRPEAADRLDTELRAQLVAASGGNPLFVEEYVRRLHHAGGRAAAAPATLGVPRTIQLLIGARLDDLPPRERALLADAAALGERFAAGALTAVSGRDPAEVTAALQHLTRREFLRRVPQPAAGQAADQAVYAFRHILIRDVAYGRLLRGDRAQRHRRAATWLESLGGGRVADQAELIAHHYLQAVTYAQDQAVAGDQPPGDLEALRGRAARALYRAGERARALAAYQAALRYYSQALELWPSGGDRSGTDLRRRLELLLRREELLVDLHQPPDPELHRELRDGLLATGDRVGAASVEAMLSSHAWRRGRLADAVAHNRRVRELLQGAPPSAAKTHALAELSISWLRLNRHAQVLEVGEEALALARTLRLPKLEARALYPVGIARTVLGDPDRGLAELRQSMRLLEQLRSAATPRAYIGLISALAHIGDLDALRETTATLERMAQQFAVREFVVWVQGIRVAYWYVLGRWDEAAALADAVIGQIRTAGGHYFEAWCRCIRAKIRLARDDLDGALQDATVAYDLARDADEHVLLPTAALRGFLLAAGLAPPGTPGGDPLEEARRIAVDLRTRIPGRLLTPFAGAELADLLARFGQMPDLDLGHIQVSPWLRALHAFHDDRPDQAAGIYASVGDRADEALARLRAGRRLAAAGQTAAAGEQLTRARAFYAEVGATRYLNEIATLQSGPAGEVTPPER